jgi:hypothetical protein
LGEADRVGLRADVGELAGQHALQLMHDRRHDALRRPALRLRGSVRGMSSGSGVARREVASLRISSAARSRSEIVDVLEPLPETTDTHFRRS